MMELGRQAGELIRQRYQIIEVLGRGSTGITYRAEDTQTQKAVALKELSLRGLRDWKQLELFEREAQTLSKLSHPGIPAYLDYFQVDDEENRWFYLVQEIAPGQSLAAQVKQGWSATETEVKQLAEKLLDILAYLHRFHPPIVHRDLKPQNVIVDADGQVFLVDFGAVQQVYHDTLAQGSTVVGTYGYMAPEQFRGQAVPASDLYALGATLLYVLTHQDPADFPQKRLKLEFRDRLSVSPELADWLDSLLEPAVEDRLGSAQDAIAILKGEWVQFNPAAVQRRQPAGSRVKLTRSRQALTIEIPPLGFRPEMLYVGSFALVWNAFILFWTTTAIASGAPLIFPLFSLPFWVVGLTMIGGLVYGLVGRTQLVIEPSRFVLKRSIWGLGAQTIGNTADLDRVEVSFAQTQIRTIPAHTSTGHSQPTTTCTLIEGVRTHRFGHALAPIEKEWLVAEIQDFLQQVRSRR